MMHCYCDECKAEIRQTLELAVEPEYPHSIVVEMSFSMDAVDCIQQMHFCEKCAVKLLTKLVKNNK